MTPEAASISGMIRLRCPPISLSSLASKKSEKN
jgi:hypothetical protein